eukprot:m.41035 g.41035  ORF g.41035 m.41035 type:complete len:399 (-) comp9732_c0_seq2:54-1250(-)
MCMHASAKVLLLLGVLPNFVTGSIDNANETSATVFLFGQVMVDLFFRIEYIRHIVFGKIETVKFIQNPEFPFHNLLDQARSLAIQSSKENTPQVILLCFLREDANNYLHNEGHWLKHVGILHIDDEKLTASLDFSTKVGYTLRNYYHHTRVEPASPNTLYFPLGWRTTDGSFWDNSGNLNLNHSHLLRDSFLGIRRTHSFVVSPDASRPTSDRPLGFFFAGQIRKGGRQDMANVVEDIKGSNIQNGSTRKKICNMNGLEQHGISGCTDIFIGDSQFLSTNLNVDNYYALMQKARYALVPCGENPESYRLWEALHAGAIPILETCGDPAMHPLRAMPGAADIFVTIWDWNQLPTLLRDLEGNLAKTDNLQRNILAWYEQYIQKIVSRITKVMMTTAFES